MEHLLTFMYTGMVDVSQMSHDSIGTLLAAAAHYKEIILHTGPLAKMMGYSTFFPDGFVGLLLNKLNIISSFSIYAKHEASKYQRLAIRSPSGHGQLLNSPFINSCLYTGTVHHPS